MNVSYLAVAPEIILVLGAVVILIVDVFASPSSRFHGWMLAIIYTGAGAAIIGQWIRVSNDGPSLSFGQTVLLTDYPTALRGVLLMTAVLGTLAAWQMLAGLGNRTAEGAALVLVSASGFMLMTSAVDLILLFVALEIGSIALYVLTGILRNSRAGDEAAVKYFLLGAFASAIFVYGAALTFAGTASTNLLRVGAFLNAFHVVRPAVILIGLGLLIVGMSFKVTAAPFHSWAPDVYQGAPAGVVGFMAAAAKVGGFAALLNILFLGFSPRYEDAWWTGIAGLAALSVILGTLLAIQQSDVRRMLAYSGVAHAGFILTGMVGNGGLSGVFFYLATYSVMLIGTFAAVAAIEGPTSSGSSFDSYRGLGRRSPLAAGVLAALLIAMSGMPLTAGFVGKFEVFRNAWRNNFQWLVIIGLLASVAALFFYLRLIVLMYFQTEETQERPVLAPARTIQWVLVLTVTITIATGIYPSPLLELLG